MLCYKTWEVLWTFSKISSSKSTPIHFHSFKGITMIQFILPLSNVYKDSLLFPPKEIWRNKFSRFKLKITSEKKKDKWSKFVPLKRRRRNETREDPNLVANGGSQAWWPMESSKFGDLWNVPCLVANGRFQAWWPLEGEGKTSFSPLFTFPCNKFYLNFFSLILKFYFAMVLGHYFMSFLPSLTYKL
jgi:hypothetical protein